MSTDGRRAGAASDDNILKVWNVESGVLIARSLPLLGAEAAQREFAANCLGAGFSSPVN